MLRRVRRGIALELVTTMLPLALVLWAIPSGLAAGAPPIPAGNTPLVDIIHLDGVIASATARYVIRAMTLVDGLHLRVKKEEPSA